MYDGRNYQFGLVWFGLNIVCDTSWMYLYVLYYEKLYYDISRIIFLLTIWLLLKYFSIFTKTFLKKSKIFKVQILHKILVNFLVLSIGIIMGIWCYNFSIYTFFILQLVLYNIFIIKIVKFISIFPTLKIIGSITIIFHIIKFLKQFLIYNIFIFLLFFFS